MTNTALKFNNVSPMPGLTVLEFPVQREQPEPPRTTSPLKSNGVKKATPADPIKDPADIKRVQEYFLSRDEIRNYTLFTLGVSFMLRISDLLSITFGDIYTGRGEPKSAFTIRERKTKKANKIAVNSKCQKALRKYYKWVTFELGGYPDSDEPLFFSKTSQNGELKAISTSMVDKILRRVQRDLQLPDHLSSHSLRKTMVYHTIKNNNYDPSTLYLLQRMLNHSDQRITFRYCGIEEEAIAELREGMADMLL